MPSKAHFTPALFKFLKELKAHNDRDWFKAHKDQYDRDVKEPALAFIRDFAPRLQKISPHFRADPRPVGGSLFRIQRDTRFSKDKSPYKTHTGIQFRHEAGKDAHCPGFYLHLEPGSVFVGLGIWHPDSQTAGRIRASLDEHPADWKRAVYGKPFSTRYSLQGDSLKRPPRGFDPEHPFLEDLKRKDFIAGCEVPLKDVTSADFLDRFTSLCKDGVPLVRFLCQAVGVAF
ncbi:MAG: DUF2461 domain-containing protein [bacterium]